MLAVLSRLSLLALGMGLVEIALGNVVEQASPTIWLILVVGVLLTLAGTAGFIRPLFESGRGRGGRDLE